MVDYFVTNFPLITRDTQPRQSFSATTIPLIIHHFLGLQGTGVIWSFDETGNIGQIFPEVFWIEFKNLKGSPSLLLDTIDDFMHIESELIGQMFLLIRKKWKFSVSSQKTKRKRVCSTIVFRCGIPSWRKLNFVFIWYRIQCCKDEGSVINVSVP